MHPDQPEKGQRANFKTSGTVGRTSPRELLSRSSAEKWPYSALMAIYFWTIHGKGGLNSLLLHPHCQLRGAISGANLSS